VTFVPSQRWRRVGRPSSRTRRLALRVAAALAVVLTACESIEISESATLSLDTAPSGASTTTTFQTRLVGRIGSDFVLENLGVDPVVVGVVAQARTRGTPADEICDAFSLRAGVEITAVRREDPAPRLGALRTPYDVSLLATDDAFEGSLRFAVTRESEWWVYTNDPALVAQVRATDGTPIPGERVTIEGSECETVAAAWRFALPDGLWTIDVSSSLPTPRLLIDEGCLQRRRVPRTCPGSEAPRVRFAPDPILASGDVTSGTLRPSFVGLGDELVLAVECIQGPCTVRMRASVHAFPLDCTSGDQCASSEVCSRDGYCVQRGSSDAGCATTPSPSTPTSWGWLAVLLGSLHLGCSLRRRR
jgi:hypothetical protein